MRNYPERMTMQKDFFVMRSRRISLLWIMEIHFYFFCLFIEKWILLTFELSVMYVWEETNLAYVKKSCKNIGWISSQGDQNIMTSFEPDLFHLIGKITRCYYPRQRSWNKLFLPAFILNDYKMRRHSIHFFSFRELESSSFMT